MTLLSHPPARTRSRPSRRLAPRPALGRLWDGVHDRALSLTMLALTVGAVLTAVSLEQPAAVVLVLAGAPILVIVGARKALVILPVAIVVRALVDNLDLQVATAGIAIALIGLALLVTWRSATWLLVLFTVSGYLIASGLAGAGRFGGAITYAEVLRLISALAVVLIVVNAGGSITAVGVARTVQAIGLIPAVFALYQFATGTGVYIDGILRASGTLAQANSAGSLFALCNVASFALVMARSPRRRLNVALLALFLGAQLATGSVGGAVTCLVMVIAHLLTLRATRIERIFLSLAAIVLVVYLAATSGVGSQRLAEYIGPGANPFSSSNSLGWRFEAWAKVLAVWREHPFFGNGAGATRAGIILGTIPHNEYVRLLAEMGVFGLSLVLIACLVYGLRMFAALRTSTDFGPSLALAVLAGSLVNGIAANTMLYSVSFYTTLFILAGCWRADQEARATRAAEQGTAGRPAGVPA